MDRERQLQSIDDDGRAIADAVRADPDGRVVSCPGWSGADLLAHVTGFHRLVDALCRGRADGDSDFPKVPPAEAARTYDTDRAAFLTALRETPADAPVANWSVAPQVAGFWPRRAVCELAVHRWDAQTLGGDPQPVPADVADDGIAEFFEVFAATGFARGFIPPAAATLVVEATDTGTRHERHLPDPGPVTTLRGSSSELFLALWGRRDVRAFHVDGPTTPLENWPSI